MIISRVINLEMETENKITFLEFHDICICGPWILKKKKNESKNENHRNVFELWC